MKIDLVIDHPLQRRIFERLVYAPSLHFSELRDKKVESNLLTYHLTKMCKMGLITKSSDKAYSLTIKGRALADRISLSNMQFRLQPKISTMIVIRAKNTGRWLMYRRHHQPFIDLIGFPSGKVHFGELIEKSVVRELKEKTGLTTNLSRRGDVYFVLHDKSDILTHFLGHIFYGETNDEEPVTEQVDKQGDVFWGDPAKYSDSSFIPGFKDVIKLVEANPNTLFFEELEYQV